MDRGQKDLEEALVLVGELQDLMSNALNAIDMRILTPESRYLAMCSAGVNEAAGGFYVLRKAGRKSSSKHMIRPMLEATISGVAAVKKKGFLFRKAYSELTEEKKAFPATPDRERRYTADVIELEKFFKKRDAAYPIEHKKINMQQAALMAGMLREYEVVYRFYCQFTHTSMAAVLGQLDQISDDLDARFVAALLLIMLDNLKRNTMVSIPDLASHQKRLRNLTSANPSS